MTLQDAIFAFEDDAKERFRLLPHMLAAEEARLANVADILARACREMEPHMQALDIAMEGCDRSGLPVRAPNGPWKSAAVDEYAVIESLCWDLSGPAQLMLKTMLHDILRNA